MTPNARALADHGRGFIRPPAKQTPTEWALEHFRFDEAAYRGPFLISGAEYIREPLDDFADTSIRDEVLCWGSQAKKTGTLMAGVAWALMNDPGGIFWVMATRELARRLSTKRLQPALRKTMPELIPRGSRRHDFTTLEMKVGAAEIILVGSNSPAALSSTPCSRAIGDEVDKFDKGGRGEADANNLMDQRTKNAANPQRWKTSTPTVVQGLIWDAFEKGDKRRYFMPCPHCNRHVIFAWSKTYTMLDLQGCEAFVQWDREAKRSDGSWDIARVIRSARAVCPHCAGHIHDGHKTRMIREGVWRPTAAAPPAYRSRHLSSLYACTPETTFGRLAEKFLQAKKSLNGLQGFINGDLAEPYTGQDTLGQRTEIITGKLQLEVVAEWKKLQTVDCQESAPYFWHVVRAWDGGNSEGIEAGPLMTWEDIRSRQLANSIQDVGVVVDSGFGAKSDAEVYKNCARFSEWQRIQDARRMTAIGWIPAKGMPGNTRWREKKTDDATAVMLPWVLRSVDPYTGTSDAGKAEMNLFEFSGDFFKDILAALRQGKGDHRWAVSQEMATETYWRHMDAEVKAPTVNKRTGRTTWGWVMRSKHWPNHLFDCEVMQVAFASFCQFFVLPPETEEPGK